MHMMNTFYMTYPWHHEWTMWPWWMFGIGVVGITFLAVITFFAIALKGYALWHAAKRNEKWWFIALLIINTVGILELIYLLFVVKKWNKKS